MQRKNTLIMTLCLLIVGLFIGTAVASDAGLAGDTTDQAEIVEEECAACQPQPLDGGETVISTDGESLTPDCPTCEEIVTEAYNYAMEQITFIFDINPEDLEGMSLIEKILYIRNAIRAPFRNFAKHFGLKLLENIDDLPFNIFEAIGGAGVKFTISWFNLLDEYGFQPGLITLEALNEVKIYVIKLCNNEDVGTNPQGMTESQPAAIASQPAVTQPMQSGTMSL